MTKSKIHISIDKGVDDALSNFDNKSQIANTILKAVLVNNPSQRRLIEASVGKLDYSKLIELGYEAMTKIVDRQRMASSYSRQFANEVASKPKPPSKQHVLKMMLAQKPATWQELEILVATNYPTFDIELLSVEAFASNQPPVSKAQEHLYRKDFLHSTYNVILNPDLTISYE